MNVDPTVIIGGAVVIGGLALTAGYAIYTGRSASTSIDVDDDGEDEMEVEFGEEENDPNPTTGTAESQSKILDPPEEVRSIGKNLTEIKGIGKTRAETFVREGYVTASDLYFATDEKLQSIDGIGPKAVEQIRSDIGSDE